MRPHWLRLTAFGAFAGTVEVDFGRLSDAGLFLLQGETGAGKTTILDALGFALYGRVPGPRGVARRLRSDHAVAGARTEVALELTVAGRRLRITRSPEQQRRKLRGPGTTTEPAKVLLEEAAGAGWRTLSTRTGEADREITDAMGMSAEQFFQVVLLPQGEFARFLRADSEERGRLLARLFGTDRFRAVEDWLAGRRRAMARELDARQARVAEVLTRIDQASGDLAGGEPGRSAAWPEDPNPVAAARLELAEAAARTAARRAGEAQRRLDGLRRTEQRERERADRQRRRAEVLDAAGALRGDEPRITALAGQLAAAHRAAQVAGALGHVTATRTDLEQAVADERAARAAAAEHPPPRPAAGGRSAAKRDAAAAVDVLVADSAALLAASAERNRRAGRFEALVELADGVRRERAAADEAAGRAEQAAAEQAAATGEAHELARRSRELTGQRDEAAAAAGALPDHRAAAKRLAGAAGDAAALAGARASVRELTDRWTAARETAVALKEQAVALRAARFDALVGELALKLDDGTPCPVCGALEHPEPAELPGRRVTAEQERAANEAADQAREGADRLRDALAEAQAHVQELTGRLAAALPDVDADRLADDPGQLADAAASAAREVERLAASGDRLAHLNADLEGVTGRLHAAEQRAAAAAAAAGAAREAAAGHTRQAELLRERLTAQLGPAASVEEAVATERAAAEALRRAAAAATERERAAELAERAGREADRAAQEAQFADAAAAGEATRDAQWRARVEAEVRDHRERVAATAAQLADPRLKVALEPRAVPQRAAEATAAAAAEHEAAVRAAERAEHRRDALASLVPALADAWAALQPVAAQATLVRRLADLAAGGDANTLRMSLSSFVLAARLEEVAAAASERLSRMTQGRYALAHTDTGRGGGRAGLGLLVQDAWTGQDRETSTLSGGETFLASLALALGLSDVVAAEAGGSPIEALFVDEGFGTLDEETLDEALDVLDGLRDGGRLVGLVSHVPELRQRIPVQVRVRKGRTGSDAVLVGV
jgi:exonuclease SbcC